FQDQDVEGFVAGRPEDLVVRQRRRGRGYDIHEGEQPFFHLCGLALEEARPLLRELAALLVLLTAALPDEFSGGQGRCRALRGTKRLVDLANEVEPLPDERVFSFAQGGLLFIDLLLAMADLL